MSAHPAQKEETNLGARVRSGARWSAGAYYANTVVRLGISILLARLLAPADFGVMALVMAFVGFITLVQDSGLSSALVQHPEPVAPAASTVLVLTTLGGLSLTALAFFGAPLVAAYMEAPQVTPLLRTLGVLFTIRGLANPARALLQRGMGFKALAAVELTSTAVYGSTGVLLAAFGYGVWALACAQIVSELVTTTMMWRSSRFRPVLGDFDMGIARELGGFGRHMVAANLLGLLHRELPTLLVGKLLGAEVLGFYWMSYRWASLPIQGLTYVASRVAYPAYARMRGDTARFGAGYVRVLRTIVNLAMPAAIGLALVAGPLMGTLYDDRWHAAVGPLRILAFFGLFAAIGSTTGEVFKGAGVPRYVTIYAVLYNVLLGIGLFVLGRMLGLEGIALATVLAPLCVAIVTVRTVAQVLAIPMRTILSLLLAPIQGTIAMTVVVLGVAKLLQMVGAGPVVELVVEVAAGGLAYGAVLYWREPAWCRDLAATAGLARSGVGAVESDVT